MSTKLEGGCYCGAVRYTLRDKPMFVQCCHCRQCQVQTGGPFVVNALIETSNIEVTGKLERVPMSDPGERPHDVYRCKKCKVALWSDYGRRPWLRFVRATTLDRAARVKPNAHIFTRSKLPWVELGEVPAFDIYYEIEALWPKRSLERRRLASGG